MIHCELCGKARCSILEVNKSIPSHLPVIALLNTGQGYLVNTVKPVFNSAAKFNVV